MCYNSEQSFRVAEGIGAGVAENNFILNRLFTQNEFLNVVNTNNSIIYDTTVQRFVDKPEDKNNGKIFGEIYKHMSKSYRNQYFYQNTLFNKLLLGKHSINTATALTQVPIAKSKADFICINGKAVVYEIKSELDTFARLNGQLQDYFKAFNHVCVVTSESHYSYAMNVLKDTPVGVYVLTSRNTISEKLRKEPSEENSYLDYAAIFKVLHKHEYEEILLQCFNKLPTVSPVFYYGECLKLFTQIPKLRAYEMALNQLKKRKKISSNRLNKIPYELKSLVYFSSLSQSDWQAINVFLNQRYGG